MHSEYIHIVNMKIFNEKYKCIKCTCTKKNSSRSYLLLKIHYLTINKYIKLYNRNYNKNMSIVYTCNII